MVEPPAKGRGPAVVALGGGHGLSTALRAVRRYAGEVTAVVSVADDGGSSGRLRRELDVPPPGDLRKCLVALAEPGTVWADAFEHRFGGGELGGHALGNLVLVGLTGTIGDFAAALDEAGRLLGAAGRVRPATTEAVVLKAQVDLGPDTGSPDTGSPDTGSPDTGSPDTGSSIEGQVAVANVAGRIRRVELVPGDVPAHPDAVRSIMSADQVVLAPGSLFTSLLPVLAVEELRRAVAATPAQVVQVCNLRPQIPETEGLVAADHLRAVLGHGCRVDWFVYDPRGLECTEAEVRELGVRPMAAGVAANGREGALVHDPERLAKALSDLLESGG